MTSSADTSMYSDMSVSDMSNLSISCRPKRKIRPPKQDLDHAVLISLVEQYPVLWDFEFPGYHNLDMRNEAWDEIAKRFHSTTGQDCLKLWTTIRKHLYQNEERHRKATASGSKATRHKPYVYAKQLSFLKKLRNEQDEITEGNGRSALDQHLSEPLYTSSPLKTPKQELQSTLVTPSPKKTKKRGNKEFKVMPTIEETDDECNADDNGLLSPKKARKIKRQKELLAKREAQTAAIKAQVLKAQSERLLQRQKTASEETVTVKREQGQLEKLQHYAASQDVDDTFTYFCMSLVDPLRALPLNISKGLRVSILKQIFEAAEDKEDQARDCVTFRKSWAKITEEMQYEIESCLNGPDDLKIIRKEYTNDLRLLDLKTLRPGVWITDTVINQYFRLVAAECQTMYPFSTHFLTKLAGIKNEEDQSHLKWTNSVDIFSFEKLLIPIHTNQGTHWVLLVVDIMSASLRYYDSMNEENDLYPQLIREYLNLEYKTKQGVELNCAWPVEQMKVTPQLNGSDCGIFVCLFGE
ncbi:uncharacterized protein LOC113216186 [Frankliniella occidentalis]|uniref:Uncharacterized protein LOC113216186 n=1 Tax=Frankliniella occidentalis TaxID=133901 RepID=A0A9C6X9U5_FRAOC|nr:uncharacterized protein LOC113216186 [Frankliniella occidentalis]